LNCTVPPVGTEALAGVTVMVVRTCGALLQDGNLNDAIHVLQLNEPLDFKYSVVYQNVQSSTGSTVMAE